MKICKLNSPEYQAKLIETLDIISDTVTGTLGPGGKTCILYDDHAIPHVTKDGVTVAEFIKFDDPFQEAINKIVKETARKTGETVGDGTTTSILLACKLTKKLIESNASRELLPEVEESINTVIKNLKESTVKLDVLDPNTIDILQAIISISSNGDIELTNTIIEALNTIGSDGLIDVMLSGNELTTVTTQEGMLIEAPAFVNKSITVNNPYVGLVSDNIEKMHQFKSFLELAYLAYQDSQKTFIIVAKGFSKEIQNVVNVNNRSKKVNILLVETDGFALNMFDVLDDMASLLNCKVLSTDPDSEYGIQNVNLKHLSSNVKTAIVSPQQTVLQSDEFLTEDNIAIKNGIIKTIENLRQVGENKIGEISALERRLSKFSKSATLYIGGSTEAEKLEKKDRADDAVKAMASAINGGIIPGGGYSLYHAGKHVSSKIVSDICKLPGFLLSQNMDCNIMEIYDSEKVMDFSTMEIGAPFTLGILDPANVSIKALQQALVITKLLLNTHSIIVPLWQDTEVA